MLTVEDALASILNHVVSGPATLTPLAQSLHRVLAEDLTTPHDSPPFDKSMMDGFAVVSGDFTAVGAQTLQVLETITAGTVPTTSLRTRDASRIMTGAPIPSGADCVVPIEQVSFDESVPKCVTIDHDVVSAEQNILRRGVIAEMGQPLTNAGTLLEPQHIAVLAEFGLAQVPTVRRPTVAVLATGDELLAVDQPLTPGRIRNSNEPMLVSQTQRANATAVPLGVARDSREDLHRHISRGLTHDFLLLSGGVSAGTLDLVPSELAAAGVQQVFHGVDMKPGKPLWFGQLQTPEHSCWVFGLPGNPVSSMVCFELFVRTAVRKFTGCSMSLPQPTPAALTKSITVKGSRPVYFPCNLHLSDEGLQATPVAWGGSADLRSTADANGMCLLMPQSDAYEAGDKVAAIHWSTM
ncbi:MAG: molybdopterin molybdotransferase MoeA [Fuerstiella sp.]|nr:molybdopterin molybdotransferase MoeA [Fuerstiella sp.]MCP4506022.1 molybdopterin molybdotransferase MoeA [Fuerstiella sp.]